MLKLLALTLLVAITACVPKPEEIKGCGSGQEFNSQTLSCVSSSPSILFASSLLALANVQEDQDYPFTLPDVTSASRANVSGDLYWFITRLPENGSIVGCANLDATGVALSAGTANRNCTYRPDPNYVGEDEFSYRVCNSLNGTSRCGQEVPVTVTVNDDGLDLPLLTVATGNIVYEGEDVFVDVRVSRRSAGESDEMYLCYQVTDPAFAFDGVPLLYQTQNPAISSSGDGCISIGRESDNLNRVVASVTAGTQLFNSCPNNDPSCTKTAQYEFRLCQEVSGNTDCRTMASNQYQRALFSITVRPLNFRPEFPSSITFPFALTPAVSEELVTEKIADPAKTAVSIGMIEIDNVTCNYDYCLPRATDLDVGQTISYEYSVATFNPGIAGTFVCTSAIQFPCYFTPAVDYNGAINFNYLARDSGNLATPAVSATLTVSPINDAPQFLASGDIYGFRPAVSLGVALSENAESDKYSLRVGEGGGSYENSQRLTIRAEHVNPARLAVLPLENIRLYRGTTLVGNLASNIGLDAANVDADTQLYSLTFEPADDVITADDFDLNLILTDDSGASNASSSFTMRIKSVENLDDPVEILDTPVFPETIGLQQGAAPKVIRFRATPGPNDWKSDFGTQKVTITLKSSAPTVINLTQASLAIEPAGAGLISITGPTICTSTSCTWEAISDGNTDPEDYDMLLSLQPGVRGAATLELIASDGPTTDNILFTANVFNFTASFNGWSRVMAQGPTVSKYATTTPGSLSFSWNDLTVTENGAAYSNYKIRVYRTADPSGLFGTIDNDTPSIDNDGFDASVNDLTLAEGATYDDGPSNIQASGEKFFYMIGIVPFDTGDVIIPIASADQKLEVIIPPNNMSLVHRWMANMQFCQETGQTPDRNNNYRCFNQGLGAVTDGLGSFFYDQSEHVFIDRFENGCPYDIQEATRTALASANADQVHYERSTGECRYSNGESWLAMSGGSSLLSTRPALAMNVAQLPPLSNLTRSQARAFCSGEKPKCNGLDCEVVESATWLSKTRDLPVRREMMIGSMWDPNINTTNRENWENSGNPLLGACNGNAAGSLAATATPTDSEFSLAAGIRALLNSGARTVNCASRYNLVNTMGNVGEWLADELSCTDQGDDTAHCTLLSTATTAAANRDALAANNSFNRTYLFTAGALPSQAAALEIDIPLNRKMSELFANPAGSFNRMHLGLGLPFEDSANGALLGAPNISTSANPPSSLFPSYFGDDEFYFAFSSNTTVDVATRYALVHGGSWRGLHPTNSIVPRAIGRFALEIRQDASATTQVGHRCVVRIPSGP